MTTIRCAICGKPHDESEIEWGYRSPDVWHHMTEVERAARGAISTDACVIDDTGYFLRGCAYIPVHGANPYAWGLWVGVTKGDYDWIVALWRKEGREREPTFRARIANELPLTIYPSSLDARCRVQLNPVGLRPAIIVDPEAHQLGIEQRDGISLERLHEIKHQLSIPG